MALPFSGASGRPRRLLTYLEVAPRAHNMAPWDDDPAPKWNGDYESETRAAKPPARTLLADVVGDALGVGDGSLLPLGAMFEIVDLAAGKCAACETGTREHV